jgi:S-adenosylmethionine hydrolase
VSRIDDGSLVGEVLWVDRFGNCQLNVDPLELTPYDGGVTVSVAGDTRIGCRVTAYDDIPTGQVGLVTDSSGLVSLAVARSSAAAELGLVEGDEVRITPLDGDTTGVVTPVALGRRPDRSTDGDDPR